MLAPCGLGEVGRARCLLWTHARQLRAHSQRRHSRNINTNVNIVDWSAPRRRSIQQRPYGIQSGLVTRYSATVFGRAPTSGHPRARLPPPLSWPQQSLAPARSLWVAPTVQPMEDESDDGTQPFSPNIKTALVVSKFTRFEWELKKWEAQAESTLQDTLASRGTDYEMLRLRHEIHERNLAEILESFQRRNVDVVLRYPHTLQPGDVANADAVFSAGGDGTFLVTADEVLCPTTPTVGLNTDPEASQGELCLRHNAGGSVKDSLEQFFEGNFKWQKRARIRVTIESGGKRPEIVTTRALNEVFVGEKSPFKASYFLLSVDGGEFQRQKNAGLIVATGTGSTAWVYNDAKLSAHAVRKLLCLSGMDAVDDVVKRVQEAYNNSLVFSPQALSMLYLCRSPIDNAIFHAESPSGFAKRIQIRSRSWDAELAVDCHHAHPFNDGCLATLEIVPEDRLLTAQLV